MKNKNFLLNVLLILGIFFYLGLAKAEQLAPETLPEVDQEKSAVTIEEVLTESSTTAKNVVANEYSSTLKEYVKTYYWAGDNLDITGHFMNDVIAGGNNITINGVVEGDVLATGSIVNIKADVKGNIRAAAGTVIIAGKIAKNASLAGGQVSVSNTGSVLKDLVVYAGTVNIEGPVSGDLKAGAGSMSLNSIIEGNADLAETGEISFGKNSSVIGDLTYSTATQNTLNDIKVRVKGEINQAEAKHKNKEKKNFTTKYSKITYWVWMFIRLLGMLLVGLVVVSVFKDTTKRVVSNMYCCPGKSFLYGLLAIIFGPALIILIMITIVGLPLGLLAMAIYLISLYLGGIFASAAIGKKLLPNSKTLVGQVFIGILILFLIKLIPFVGEFVCVLLVIWAVGGMIRKKCVCEKKQKNVVQPEIKNIVQVKKIIQKKQTPAKKNVKKTTVKDKPKKTKTTSAKTKSKKTKTTSAKSAVSKKIIKKKGEKK